MPNAAWAEWIIARLTDRTRAATIVGDLLESGGEERPVWFWWSATGVVLSLVWRSLAGLAAAYFCLSAISHAWFLEQCPQGRGSRFAMGNFCPSSALVHDPPQIWMSLFGPLCIVAAYAVARYGVRDRFAQLALALCAPSIVVGFYWWVPAVVFSYAVLVLSIISLSTAFVHSRKALLVLAAALVCGYAAIQFAPYLADRYLQLASPSVTRSVIVHGSVPFLWVAAPAIACELMHRLLLRPSHQ